MKEKDIIIEVLTKAGFVQHGKNSYKSISHNATLFMKEYTYSELVSKLINIGASNQCHEIRKALRMNEEFDGFIYKAQA